MTENESQSISANPVYPVECFFNPALEGGNPTLDIHPKKEWKSSHPGIRVTNYAVDSPDYIFSREELPSEIPHQFILPHRGKRDILGIRIEQINPDDYQLLADYRTLFLEGKSLMDYKGNPELFEPDDFDEYWIKAKKELYSCPMNPELILIPEGETRTGILYKVRLNSIRDIPICGWYYCPKNTQRKKYPAVQLMPGYGAEEPPQDRTWENVITFALSPRGHGHSGEKFPLPIAHHLWNIHDEENYYYRLAFMDGLRGLEFLRSRPEIDINRIAVEGGSQGGLLTVATAALDGKVCSVTTYILTMVNFPDLLNLATEGSTTVTAQYLRQYPEYEKSVKRILSYIDGAFLAKRIQQAPVLIYMGHQDRICPSLNGIVAYNHLPKNLPKKLCFDPNAGHEVTLPMIRLNRHWQKTYLNPGPDPVS